MKILKTISILAIVSVLIIGGTGSVFAKGPPEGLPQGGEHSPGKRGLFGTAISTDGYVINLETKKGQTIAVTLPEDAKYKVPGETKGYVDRDGFEMILDGAVDDNITAIEGMRIAVLVNFTDGDTADALRLMLIKVTPPLHAHRVGIVTEFEYTEGEGGSITIIDNKGVSHAFEVSDDAVFRPEETTEENIIPYESCVTVVTKGDPKLEPQAKAIVLHEELPDWAGGRIIVKKIVDSGDTEQDFEFDLDPDWDVASFSLSGGEKYKSGWLEPGEYTVEELLDGLTGWDLSETDPIVIYTEDLGDTSTYDPDAHTATIDLDMGETVTVTFHNTYTPE